MFPCYFIQSSSLFLSMAENCINNLLRNSQEAIGMIRFCFYIYSTSRYSIIQIVFMCA